MQSIVTDLILERLKISRKTSSKNLASFSSQIVSCIAMADKKEAIILENLVESFLPELLQDCEIFFEMPYDKAMDALQELSNYACIFGNDQGFSYIKVVEIMDKIKASYPIQQLNWKGKETLPMINYDE